MMVDVDELLAAIDRDAKVLKNEYAPVRLVADIFKSVIKTVADASGYEMPEWISVKDRLPEEKGEYLTAYHPCYWDNVDYHVVQIDKDTWRGMTTWAKHKYHRVTHWMPLPEPPKEGA